MPIRNSLEITAEILRLCQKPQTKTRVMYGANLSWGLLQKYLSKLQAKRLLEVQNSQTRYVTTQKGLEFVKTWGELVELL
jgi:predicted transcriptional regulator